jgi:hypothetical protein
MPVSNDPPVTDVNAYALDLIYTSMFRETLESQNEDADEIALGVEAQLMAHSASGFN